ncbi:hypothetical protein PSRA_0094 [Pseudoscardovia radai]|uniref:SPOR domain-containing protein n=1 Tax=Pseudoscardovia radai TaxID=987066 RepID=A0A261F2E1_9BIFI|nr:hypothetical protein [Pseudoscardovia radai]MDO5687787.1 hypothetical protein [Pseudoscardovia radai]OZG53287.1 hypothetical protein PSRA_0094 [Pseudoscardovia radai]
MTDMKDQWFFNTKTGQPELGPKSPANVRLGPYKSREAALKAWQIVRERNAKWEKDDREWRS